MNIGSLHIVFSFIAIIAAILTVVSTIGTYWTGNIIDQERKAQIIELQPRHLSSEQRERLLHYISSTKAKIGFMSRFMDGESGDFANDLIDVFKEANWEIAPKVNNSLSDLPGFVTTAITFPKDKTEEDLRIEANLICEAFNQANVSCKTVAIKQNSFSAELPPDTVYVIVGRKSH